MGQLFVNNFKTTLASGYTAGAASISLASGTDVPAVTAPDFWLVTLDDNTNKTVLKVTSCTAGATTLTVSTTIYEGATASYSAGAAVQGRFTAASAGNMTQKDYDYSYLGKYNSGGQARPPSGAGLAVGYNYNSGSREVDFWNLDVQASSYSFYWMQKTGTSTHAVLMYLMAGGTLVLPVNSAAGDGNGSLIVGSPSGSADGGICCYGGIYCINGVGTFLQGLSIAASKGIAISSGAPATTTNKLYQVSSVLFFNGAAVAGMARNTFSNANYTITGAGDQVVSQVGTMSAARTVTLPAANGRAGQMIVIVDESGTVTQTNKLTISRGGTDTIGPGTSATSFDLFTAGSTVILVADGTSKWNVVQMSRQRWFVTSTTAWVCPPGVFFGDTVSVAAGGGGGGGDATPGGGGGGGGGQVSIKRVAVSPGTSYTATIGAGGTGAAAAGGGNDGGDTTFGSLVTAKGGRGGWGSGGTQVSKGGYPGGYVDTSIEPGNSVVLLPPGAGGCGYSSVPSVTPMNGAGSSFAMGGAKSTHAGGGGASLGYGGAGGENGGGAPETSKGGGGGGGGGGSTCSGANGADGCFEIAYGV